MVQSNDWLYVAGWYLLRGLGRILVAFEVQGAEHVPLEGPLIVAPNHSSYLDPPVVGMACPRQLRYMGKAELFENPLVARFLSRFGAFPVHRGTADLRAIRTALQFLKQGEAVLIFPEGGRNSGTELRPPTPGATLLARQSGAPVTPVGIIGTHIMWPRDRKLPRLAKLKVVFGQPFTFQEITKGIPEREARNLFTQYLMEQIVALLWAHKQPYRDDFILGPGD